jgi:RNA polymerase sigma factor (sigma-70 family)
MHELDGTVFIVDDDPSVRKALERLVRSIGMRTKTFASAEAFLGYHRAEKGPCCVILDMQMPGTSGLAAQRALAASDPSLPIIVLTAHADVPLTIESMKVGASEFLLKPFDRTALIAAILRSIEHHRAASQRDAEIAELRKRVDSLTPRERQVFALVVAGKLNKQIAAALGITEKTVKVHRSRVMQRMHATSLAELVHQAELLQMVEGLFAPSAHRRPS